MTKKLSKKKKEKEKTRVMYFFECINVCDCLDLEEDSFITLLIYNKRPFGFASRSVVVSKGGFGFLSSPSGLKDEYSRTQNENEKGCQIPTTKKKKKTERTPRAKRIVFTVLVFSCFLLLDR